MIDIPLTIITLLGACAVCVLVIYACILIDRAIDRAIKKKPDEPYVPYKVEPYESPDDKFEWPYRPDIYKEEE